MTPTTSFAIPAPSITLPPQTADELSLASLRVIGAMSMAIGVVTAWTQADGSVLCLVAAAALSPGAARIIEEFDGRAPWIVVAVAGLALAFASLIVG
jgi:hypothetical protein